MIKLLNMCKFTKDNSSWSFAKIIQKLQLVIPTLWYLLMISIFLFQNELLYIFNVGTYLKCILSILNKLVIHFHFNKWCTDIFTIQQSCIFSNFQLIFLRFVPWTSQVIIRWKSRVQPGRFNHPVEQFSLVNFTVCTAFEWE